MSEWRLAPTWKITGGAQNYSVPPIPLTTWDAMVERGARATFLRRNGSKTSWAWDSSGLDDEHPGARARYLHDAETALRAALGNPTIEETYEDWSARITGMKP